MPRIASLVLICCVSLMSTLLLRDMEELVSGKGGSAQGVLHPIRY
jgi:hypothetical protein